MGDDLVGERLPEERRDDAVEDARIGRMKRRELTQMLLEPGLHRSGSVTDFTTTVVQQRRLPISRLTCGHVSRAVA